MFALGRFLARHGYEVYSYDYLTTRKADLLTSIRTEAKLTEPIEAGLKAAADEWKSTFAAK